MLSGSLVELCRHAVLACLGCFLGLLRTLLVSLGPSLGVSWASLGDLGVFLGPSWPCWASLGLLFWPIQCSFGVSWAALGRPCSTLLAQEAARQRQGAPRQPQKLPKRRPREPKWYPKRAIFVSFWGSFFELSSGLLSDGFLDAWPLKICDFAWEVLQKHCFP